MVSWALYIVGIVLVLGSYVGWVSGGWGWMGWLVGMAGWAMFYLPGVRGRSPAQQIAEFAALRDQGAITDEEFEREKARILEPHRFV